LFLAVFRYLFALTVLAYASYSDVKSREVSDLVWFVGCPVAATLDLVEVLWGELPIVALVISAAASVSLGFLFFRLGLVGGADALALFFTGLALPAYPPGFPLLRDPVSLPVLSVLCNLALCSLVCPVTVFALNVADILRGRNPFRGVEVEGVGGLVVLMFTTRRVSLERLRSGLHYFPAERPADEGGRVVRRPIRFLGAEADVSAIKDEIAGRSDLYADGVLASPTSPMILFLTFGFALSPVGNILLYTAYSFLGL
jgi:hypothetical protein